VAIRMGGGTQRDCLSWGVLVSPLCHRPVVLSGARHFHIICSRKGLELGTPKSLQDSWYMLLSTARPQRLSREGGDRG
jgi:hypothetical protein